MKLSVPFALALLSLPALAQSTRPIPGVRATTAVGGTVSVSSNPLIGTPVSVHKDFLGSGIRTASASFGSTGSIQAFGMGRARARARGKSPQIELVGRGYALGTDPFGTSFVGLGGGFLVPPGTVAHVHMSGSLQTGSGTGGGGPRVNAMVTDGLSHTRFELTQTGQASRYAVLPPGGYSVTGNLFVSGFDSSRQSGEFQIHVGIQVMVPLAPLPLR